jgi:hypothetical protein
MFVLAMALAAQDATEKVEGWTISTNLRKDECTMSATLVSGADVSFHWRPRKRAGALLYRSPEFKSLEQNKDYKIEVGFEKSGKLDMGWGERAATGNVSSDGTRGFLIAFSGKEILSDIAASTKIGFWYKDKLVGAVPLKGSGKAIAAVRRCEDSVLKQVARDPFEQ